MPKSHYASEINEIGVKIMNAHVLAINQYESSTGQLSSATFRDYHYSIFEAYGLDKGVYGGTSVDWLAKLATDIIADCGA